MLTAEGMRNGVCSLYTAKCKWDAVVMPNVRHIIRGILSGTAYLHEDMCIQHVDLKGKCTEPYFLLHMSLTFGAHVQRGLPYLVASFSCGERACSLSVAL